MAEKSRTEGVENTLGVENAIRTAYLRDRIGGAYYENSRIRQAVTLDDPKRGDMARASPESTMKMIVCAKYLILEMWRFELEERRVEGIIGEMEGGGHHELAEALRADLGTMEAVAEMRDRFSAHPTYPLAEAVEKMEEMGLARFWQCVQRLLLFRRAAGAVSHAASQPGRATEDDPGERRLPYRIPAAGEVEAMRGRYERVSCKAEWPDETSRRIMQECVACVYELLTEIRIAVNLHAGCPGEASGERLCNTVYSLKYVILEMHDFIKRCGKMEHSGKKWRRGTKKWCGSLELSERPGFFAREKKYKEYRDRYAAHEDGRKRVVSIVQLLGDADFVSMLVLDMHEAVCLGDRLFPRFRPRERFTLPTGAEIAGMDREIGAVAQKIRAWSGDGGYERACGEFRARIKRACGIA